jgi:glutamate dehydrogenase
MPPTSAARVQLQAALRSWKGSVSTTDRPLFNSFVEAAVGRLRGAFLSDHSPHEALTWFEEAFRLCRTREPGSVSINVRPGFADRGALVLTLMEDQPFIVDTLRLFLKKHHAEYRGGFNLVIPLQRDAAGHLVAVGGDGEPESIGITHADAGTLLDDPRQTEAELRRNLQLAHCAVVDFVQSVNLVGELVKYLNELGTPEAVETSAFLSWLSAENFVFLGAQQGETKLGFQAMEPPFAGTTGGDWPDAHPPGMVRLRKSGVESPVHRSGRIDEILVVVPGRPELYLRGLFTYRGISAPSRSVPILRGVLKEILAQQQSAPGSFRYKGIANVFDALPTEFLFASTRNAITEIVDRVFEAEQSQEVYLGVHTGTPGTALALLAMPQGRYSEDLRRRIEAELCRSLAASSSEFGVYVSRYDTVLLHYYLRLTDSMPSRTEIQALGASIQEMATPWSERLWRGLVEAYGEDEADRLLEKYGHSFGEAWSRNNSGERTVRDVQQLEGMAERRVSADLFEGSEPDTLVLRLYQSEDVYLTDILPVLDHFGLVVIDASANTVVTPGQTYHIDSFRLQRTDSTFERRDLLLDALHCVFAGSVTDDVLNRLVVTAGLSWKDVDVLRGYMRYCRQFQIKIDPARMQEILLSNPVTCHALMDTFHARFDPDLTGDRAAQMATAEQLVRDEIKLILSHDEDLLLSAIFQLIRASVRTNYYRTDKKSHYISFKLDCADVKLMGRNRPMFEIWVHAKDVEGVHLRFGKVARGGIRWSDRDDFRTEVLGLVTTQQVKNVVIVPTGSKGGFFLKKPSRDPISRRREADLLYQTFIRGLLDVTDNSHDGQIVAPPRVVRHDPDDPYLVVAADKGTAHLSDTANGISIEYDYWLGDAFASGGSHGYDHKKVGITARGGWVLVKRHFAELGRDPYTQDFTCFGIGDMGGDVFGNGLIESRHTKLLAAFNHVHIFLDPNPDPERTFVERKRLFDGVRGWDAYDRSLLSEGGGIFQRNAKSIPLSPQIQDMLGLRQDEAEPDVVMNHILKMDVDLFWNGGIGTYVKASTETHADADDKSNNAVRVDATELRAKIVGEGGNLGFTQRGRIEAALAGVHLNTDAIDNSGGVDMSDHEVNLKILVNRIVASGSMTMDGRNHLLEEMTEEVADLVLHDNDAQGRQLSRDIFRSRHDVFQFGRAISFIEREFGRDRSTLFLPSEEEVARRAESGTGLTRPELAVLQAWVKMYVRRELLNTDPRQLPGFDEMLMSYFPKRIQERFPNEIRQHMLANEIAVTVAVTRIVADAGAGFFPVNIEASGATVLEVASAYLKAQRLARTDEIRATIEQIKPTVALSALNRCWVMFDQGVREVARYWLSSRGKIPTDAEVDRMQTAADSVFQLQASEVRARNLKVMSELRELEVPEVVARRVLQAQYLHIALMVWAESERAGVPFQEAVVKHLAISRASGLQDVIDGLSSRPASGRWDPLAFRILYNRFYGLLKKLVNRTPVSAVGRTVDQLEPELSAGALKDVRAQVDAILGKKGAPTVSTLLVLEERVEAAISRLG